MLTTNSPKLLGDCLTTYLLLSSAFMHSLNFVGQRGCAESMRVLGSFVDVAEGHFLGKLLLAFRDKLMMFFPAMEEGARDTMFPRGLSLLEFFWGAVLTSGAGSCFP